MATDLVHDVPGERLAALQDFQRALAQCEQIPIPLIHSFAPGQYARTCFLPAGTVAIGKIHRHAHLIIISAGDLLIETEAGLERVTGFRVFTSPAGIKRAVQVFADTILTTIHNTPLTDLDAIDAEMTVPEPSPFEVLEVTP